MRSPEFPLDLRWFNSEPLRMRNLRDQKTVLIDFWTYSCVNCQRTLPHLKEWHKRYSSAGLVIVGAHTPEFEFEKNVGNVQRAIKEFEIEYPVVMDNDYQIWSLYSNNIWPRKFLIDKDGQIVYDHAGEGNYKETEEAIQKALLEINPKLKLPTIDLNDDGSTSLTTGKVCLPATPETYLGAMRGRPGKTWNHHGIWKVHPEFIEHERKTQNFEDYLEINFQAAEVNLVMEALSERPAKIRLELDGSTSLATGGKFLRELEVHEPKMYNLVSGNEMLNGKLKIFVKDQGLRAYAFTFGGCVTRG